MKSDAFCPPNSRGTYEGEDLWQDAARLAEAPPLCVSLDDLKVSFISGDVPLQQVGVALNGAIVGLASSLDAHSVDGLEVGEGPLLLPCLGLGLVRSVDTHARRLYILSPLAYDPEALERVDTLLVGNKELGRSILFQPTPLSQVGKIELPTSLLQPSDMAVSPYLSLFCLSTEGTASGGTKGRTTLERKGLVHKL